MSLILSGTDGLSDVDGSAATPAIRGTDANTGIFFPAADTIAFSEGGVEAMRIDSSGNLGVGTTSPSTKLHVAGAITAATTGQFFVSNGASTTNQYFNVLNTGGSFFLGVENSSGGSLATGSSAYASLLTTQGATSLQFGTNLNVRATINSSGSFGIGTTNIQERLTVQDNIQITNSASNLSGLYFGTNANPGQRFSYIESDARSTGYISFSTNALERARIDSSGRLLVGTTSAPVGGANSAWANSGSTVFSMGPNGGNAFVLYNPSSVGCYVVGGQTGWTGTSDGTLKNVIAPITSGLTSIIGLKPTIYSWKYDESNTPYAGLIAQEVQTVLPNLVNDNNGTLGVNYTGLIPYLISSIQELNAKFEAYKATHP
jgi:hypothetical protein